MRTSELDTQFSHNIFVRGRPRYDTIGMHMLCGGVIVM
jgi:hypothetical protein